MFSGGIEKKNSVKWIQWLETLTFTRKTLERRSSRLSIVSFENWSLLMLSTVPIPIPDEEKKLT